MNINSAAGRLIKNAVTGNYKAGPDQVKLARSVANYALDGLENNLRSDIMKKVPELVDGSGFDTYIKNDTIQRRAQVAIKSFFGMPLDILDSVAKKFPDSKLAQSKLITNHRNNVLVEKEIKALQGIYENGTAFLEEAKFYAHDKDLCKKCGSVTQSVTDRFNKLLDDTMGTSKAVYDTKKERFTARLVSGGIATLFLGTDFYNKAIQKGKTDEEAKKEQSLKQGQEIRENACEAVTQFAAFACFSKFVNTKVWGAPVIAAAIGLASRIISRKAAGMSLVRDKVEDKPKTNMPKIADYVSFAKKGMADELVQTTNKETLETKEHKKAPLLSLKNILVATGACILGGYALRFGKNHTKIGKQIADFVANSGRNIEKKMIKDIYTDSEHLTKLAKILYENGDAQLSHTVATVANAYSKDGKIFLGTEYKTLGNTGIKIKDLASIPLIALKFAKELVSYPYKMASKLEYAIRSKNAQDAGKMLLEGPKLIQNRHNIKNLYNRFVEFERKYGDDEAKLAEEFGKYVKDMRLLSVDAATSSKNNNSQIAVIAQVLGTMTGIGFNMTDEFNASVRNGSTKEEAEKDARLRGINKIFRMFSQIAIAGTLNNVFEKQYNSSIARAGLVVGASTVLTDITARLLSGMPSKKMNKEELENYQEKNKNGTFSWFYKMLDKLAS